MPMSNLERMIALADEFFQAKTDPQQISVTEDIINRLRQIHPHTLKAETDENGPIAWILVLPTTHALMEQFISKKLTEEELLDQTPVGGRYDALYLCSALVLPEHRGKRLARRLTMQAVKSINNDHPIRTLFFWSFSVEGEKLAHAIAVESGMPLLRRL